MKDDMIKWFGSALPNFLQKAMEGECFILFSGPQHEYQWLVLVVGTTYNMERIRGKKDKQSRKIKLFK
jgi:hypothetical protein